MTRNERKEELKRLLNNRSLDRLQKEFDLVCERWNYLPERWEWETMATQLATAICKINYRYWNDWDRYDRRSCRYELWTFASWIHNNCFKLKRFKDYEDNLKYMLIMWMSIIDSLKNEDSRWSVYEEVWTWNK